jgi:TolB-like protein
MKRLLLAFALITTLAGCSSLPSVGWLGGSSKAATPAPPPPRQATAGKAAPCMGMGSDCPAPTAKEPQQTAGFNTVIAELAVQLESHNGRKQANATYLIGSFTHLNNLAETSPLGRLIGESLIHELQVRGWRIFEPRLMQNFMINRDGEFVLSRDVKNLKDQFGVTAVVTGTFMLAQDQVWINARVIDSQSGLVLSTGQAKVPASWVEDQLASTAKVATANSDTTPSFRIVGDRP